MTQFGRLKTRQSYLQESTLKMGLWYRLKTPTTEPSRAWRLADDLSDDDDPPAPKRAKSRPPRWTADEETAVKDGYQMYGDKWAKILREFSVLRKGGRTSADVRDKFRNLVKKDPALAGPPKRGAARRAAT